MPCRARYERGETISERHVQAVWYDRDIRPRDPRQFSRLVEFLRHHELTDQLLTGNGWMHISWNPFDKPRHYVRTGYYK